MRRRRAGEIFASDSPETPATISGAATLKNGTPASRAMACASVVFPHPGGPCKSTPRGGSAEPRVQFRVHQRAEDELGESRPGPLDAPQIRDETSQRRARRRRGPHRTRRPRPGIAVPDRTGPRVRSPLPPRRYFLPPGVVFDEVALAELGSTPVCFAVSSAALLLAAGRPSSSCRSSREDLARQSTARSPSQARCGQPPRRTSRRRLARREGPFEVWFGFSPSPPRLWRRWRCRRLGRPAAGSFFCGERTRALRGDRLRLRRSSGAELLAGHLGGLRGGPRRALASAAPPRRRFRRVSRGGRSSPARRRRLPRRARPPLRPPRTRPRLCRHSSLPSLSSSSSLSSSEPLSSSSPPPPRARPPS